MIDTNDSEFLSRIEDKSLLSKVMPGAAAAAMINAGDIIGIPDLRHAAIRKLQCMNSQNA